MKQAIFYIISILLLSLCLAGCSSSRHVPDGQYLLDQVHINIEDSTNTFDEEVLVNYLRQTPNHKILWSTKLQLGIYNMSGKDTTKWYNRWIRRIGEAPVIYDSKLTDQSAGQLQKALINQGYLEATVDVDTVANQKKKKMKVYYSLTPGKPHVIHSIDYKFSNDSIRDLVMSDSTRFIIREGDNLDRDRLELQRQRFTQVLRNNGYYAFAKEFITFNADTTENSYDVDLTVIVNPPYDARQGEKDMSTHVPYFIRDIKVITDYDPVTMENPADVESADVVKYGNITILYGDKKYLRPNILDENCYIKPGKPFKEIEMTRTYEAFSRLGILKFINIQFVQVADIEGEQWLDAYILLTPTKSQSISLELEGTNSEGDLGVAAAVSYAHRNIGKGSETLQVKLQGAYESLSGDLDGLINNRYMEYTLDVGLTFPKFKFPFLNKEFKQKIRATTEFNTSLNYQERPEYTRIIATAGFNYKWTERNNRIRHTFTPLDINYVYLPENTNNFIDEIAPDNPLLRYSYEDHFIMRLGYSFYYTTKRPETAWTRKLQSNVSTIRFNAETAGNLLYAVNNIFNHRDNAAENPYKVFGIQYSQYFKIEGDYSYTHTFSPRHSLAFHAGIGVAYPYGNSRILPFEKRFYGGGANGVRGWDVRTLGPGAYNTSNTVNNFIYQCGDIRLDLSLEYRAKLFWVIEMAAFIDAGNIWTIHDYADQPNGMFRFKTFYKQIAAAYGLGIRLDFNYFLLRFDMGMKAHNPAEGQEKWPLIHPRWGRDSSFHFSIGYPF